MSSTEEGYEELAIPDMLRRLLNVVRPGKISQVDYQKALIRVKHGELESNWIPWAAGRAGGNKTWQAPEVGEQVLMLSPGGDMSRAIALPGIFSEANPANGDSADITRMTFSDGTVIEYNRASKQLNAKLSSGGRANIEADGGITIKGDITLDGALTMSKDLQVNGSVMAQGEVTTLAAGAPVNLSTHTHTGVIPGTGFTANPTPGT